jgi:hypothetical protein
MFELLTISVGVETEVLLTALTENVTTPSLLPVRSKVTLWVASVVGAVMVLVSTDLPSMSAVTETELASPFSLKDTVGFCGFDELTVTL